jgi:hypothetical protein
LAIYERTVVGLQVGQLIDVALTHQRRVTLRHRRIFQYEVILWCGADPDLAVGQRKLARFAAADRDQTRHFPIGPLEPHFPRTSINQVCVRAILVASASRLSARAGPIGYR